MKIPKTQEELDKLSPKDMKSLLSGLIQLTTIQVSPEEFPYLKKNFERDYDKVMAARKNLVTALSELASDTHGNTAHLEKKVLLRSTLLSEACSEFQRRVNSLFDLYLKQAKSIDEEGDEIEEIEDEELEDDDQ